MSLLAATIADALRPLPGRRGNFIVQRAAFEEPEPEIVDGGDSAALTVYRLQKDGANPIAPVAPTRGSGTISRGGPSAGVNHALDVGDPGVAINHVERLGIPFVEGRNERNVRESRFASTETRVPNAWSPSIPPPQRVGSSPSQTASNVSFSDVDSQSETSGQTDQRSGGRRVARSAPSETSEDAQPARPTSRDVALTRRLIDAVAGGENAAAMAASTAAERAGSLEAGVHADVPLFADAVIEPTHGAARARRDAGASEVRLRHVAAPAVTSLASDSGAPRVHIGRIDVTVLADSPAPDAGARGSSDDDRHFLSRHYLRRP